MCILLYSHVSFLKQWLLGYLSTRVGAKRLMRNRKSFQAS